MTATEGDELARRRIQRDDIDDELRVIADLYATGHPLILDRPSVNYDPARAGKPSSSLPRGTDHRLKAALVSCARHLADAGQWLQRQGCPTKPWKPAGLGYRNPQIDCKVRHRDGEHVIVCRVTEWQPDADDMRLDPPSPPVIEVACDRLAGMIRWARTADVDLGEAGHHIGRARRALERIEKVVEGVGMDADGNPTIVRRWVGLGRPEGYPFDWQRCEHFFDPEVRCHRLREQREDGTLRRKCQTCRKNPPAVAS